MFGLVSMSVISQSNIFTLSLSLKRALPLYIEDLLYKHDKDMSTPVLN